MDFSYSSKVKELQLKLTDFMEQHVYPNEWVYEQQVNEGDSRWSSVPPIMEELKEKAKAEGLWNLFLPESELWCWFNKPGICAAMRDYGAFLHWSRSF